MNNVAKIRGPDFVSRLRRIVYLASVVQMVRAVHDESLLEMFPSLAESVGVLFGAVNNCEFSCPKGTEKVKNPKHVASSNGCGSYGIQIVMDNFPKITRCCNEHDYCYGTCGSSKQQCDKAFKQCIRRLCDTANDNAFEKTCKSLAKVFFGGTAVFGCPAFVSAQETACLCNPLTHYSKRRQDL